MMTISKSIYSQRDKMLHDKDKVTWIQDEPITHTIDVAFFVQAKEVVDYITGNHLVVQLISLFSKRKILY